MRIGLVGTRLVGVDGVSFEAAKWETVLRRLGHDTSQCAGAVDPAQAGSRQIEEMHFTHPLAARVSAAAFDPDADPEAVRQEVRRLARELVPKIAAWVGEAAIEVLIVQNAWAIPMQLPLGVALAEVVRGLELPTIGHHHDYVWERDRFAHCVVPDLLEEAFPPDLPSIYHVSINSPASNELRRRRGIESTVITNVFDFGEPPLQRDEFSRSLRDQLGMGPDNLLVVQPTRVVPRKGIELAIELVARLDDPRAHLLITSPAGDEGTEYLSRLHLLADRLGVDLRYAADRFGPQRAERDGHRTYSLPDSYVEADLVTYPSLYEGFGNALVETVYFGRPLVVNRYTVYDADIRPLGFRFVELDGEVTDAVVDEVHALLADPARQAADAAHNFEIGRRHLSYESLEDRLRTILGELASAR